MRWLATIFFLPILASAEVGQPISKSDLVNYTTAVFIGTDGSQVNASNFENYLDEVARKRDNFRNDQAYLEFIFNSTHRKFLKNFKAYSSFGQLLKNGSYNCLTATALYALVLEQTGIKYEIIETNYHIFLMAYTDEGSVLMETTDPVKGFVTDSREIEKRINTYKEKENELKENKNQDHYQLDCNLYNVVKLEEMAGLLHYNLAIAAHNDHQLELSIEHLDQATNLYNSPRMEALTRLVLLSVVESKMDAESKTLSIKRIQAFRKRNLMALAQASR